MNKFSIGAIAGLSVALLAGTSATAADLPIFSTSDSTVAPGQVVTITVTPGTGDGVFPAGPDYLGDPCAAILGSGDTSTRNNSGFSFAGTFDQDQGTYVHRDYPGTPVVAVDTDTQYASAGWGNFVPNEQSTPFSFDFTIPDDVVLGEEYSLQFTCISPNFWVRDPATFTRYSIGFVVESDANNGGGNSNSNGNQLSETGAGDQIFASTMFAGGVFLLLGSAAFWRRARSSRA